MIPKIINYCWFGGKPLPNDVKKCIESWKKYCPDYKIVEWNESNFDVHSHPFMDKAYQDKAWAFVSDYARLKIIYENGGIYLDTDVELIKNIDHLLNYKMFVSIQQQGWLLATGLGFGAEKEHPVIREMLSEYDKVEFDGSDRLSVSCPFLNTKVIENHGYKKTNDIVTLDEITVLPPRYMDPIAPGDTENLFCDDTVSIHHYSATWRSGKERAKRKLFNFIGQDKVNNIKRVLKRKQ